MKNFLLITLLLFVNFSCQQKDIIKPQPNINSEIKLSSFIFVTANQNKFHAKAYIRITNDEIFEAWIEDVLFDKLLLYIKTESKNRIKIYNIEEKYSSTIINDDMYLTLTQGIPILMNLNNREQNIRFGEVELSVSKTNLKGEAKKIQIKDSYGEIIFDLTDSPFKVYNISVGNFYEIDKEYESISSLLGEW